MNWRAGHKPVVGKNGEGQNGLRQIVLIGGETDLEADLIWNITPYFPFFSQFLWLSYCI
jgi:hypothetical protein